MALAGLDVYRRAVRGGSPQLREGLDAGDDLFDPGQLYGIHNAAESERLNEPSFPCIIISASGMGTGGRVVHHLRHQLPNPRNTVVLTGFQAIGTRGRQLLDGARQIKMHGRYVPVHAEVVSIPDFSVHADRSGIVDWLRSGQARPESVYVVHGEPQASASLAQQIRDEVGCPAVVPSLGERVLVE
jgi:metallo-beta-lactamase family protein